MWGQHGGWPTPTPCRSAIRRGPGSFKQLLRQLVREPRQSLDVAFRAVARTLGMKGVPDLDREARCNELLRVLARVTAL